MGGSTRSSSTNEAKAWQALRPAEQVPHLRVETVKAHGRIVCFGSALFLEGEDVPRTLAVPPTLAAAESPKSQFVNRPYGTANLMAPVTFGQSRECLYLNRKAILLDNS